MCLVPGPIFPHHHRRDRPELCSLKYAAIDQAILLGKFDLASTYRQVPFHPLDQPVLGLTWDGVTYIDKALPFGLRSAIMTQGHSGFIHYLNDFSSSVPRALRPPTGTLLHMWQPLWQTTSIHCLGILIDSVAGTTSLTGENLQALRNLMVTWGKRKDVSYFLPLWYSMDRALGLISFGQSISHSSSEFGILQGSYAGTPTPVPLFLFR